MNRAQSLIFAAAVCAALALVGAYKFGPRIYNRHRLQQLQGRQVYDEKLDARSAFDAALARAKSEHKHVLVIFGGNWCQWCLSLDDLLHQDTALREYVAAHYVVLKIDSQAGKVLDQAWGFPTHRGVPVLVFVDDKGELKHVQETVSLELWNGRILGHDPRRVLGVLQHWS